MNNLRRKRLSEIAAKIEELKADLEEIQEEEEAAIPLYESDRDDIQATMDVLEQLDNFEEDIS